tara:strand:+ start:520 stop:687 length:168 start_codon:yes stop_codon:yes gene_type:complete
MKTLYLISVLNANNKTCIEIADLLSPDAVADASSYDWEFCSIKKITIGETVSDLF